MKVFSVFPLQFNDAPAFTFDNDSGVFAQIQLVFIDFVDIKSHKIKISCFQCHLILSFQPLQNMSIHYAVQVVNDDFFQKRAFIYFFYFDGIANRGKTESVRPMSFSILGTSGPVMLPDQSE